MLIRKLKLANFRSIGERGIEIEFKPLTIFVGPNASGKSSILLALDWLAKRAGKEIYAPPTDYERKIHGVNAFKDYIFARDLRRKLSMEIEFFLPKELIDPVKSLTKRISNLEHPQSITYGFYYHHPYYELYPDRLHYGNYSVFLRFDKTAEIHVEQTFDCVKREITRKLSGSFGEEQAKDARALNLFRYTPFEGFSKLEGIRYAIDKFFDIFRENILSRFYLLTALRGYVEYEVQVETSLDVGAKGEKLIETSSTLLATYDLDIREKLGEKYLYWLEKFGLRKFSAGLKERQLLGASYLDDSGKRLDLALASHGCKQIASVVAELIATPEHSVVMIEEPEISLHPEHQALLPLLFADVIKSFNKQVIVSTHSTILILALMDAVEGHPDYDVPTLEANEIAVYHVERKNGQTIVKPLELSPEGLPKEGIPSFLRVEQELFKRLVRRVSRREC